MAILPNDRVIEYSELEALPEETRAKIDDVFKLFLDGIGKKPLSASEMKLNKEVAIGVIIADRVNQAIYFAAKEGYYLNNLTLPDGRRPLDVAQEVFEEHSKRQADKRFNFIEPMKIIMTNLLSLEAGYAAFKGEKNEYIEKVKNDYARILGVGSAEGVEKEPLPPIKIPPPQTLESSGSWSDLAGKREDRANDPKRGGGEAGKWLD